MAFTPKEADMQTAVAQFARPGEELITVGWAAEKGTKYYYVALTNQRILLIRLSMFYKVKGEESIELSDLEAASMEEGFRYAPIDMQLLSSMLETSLYLKTRDGKKRAMRFNRFIGYPNTEIPGRIVEALYGNRQ
jgi:hypothetical protein